MPESLAFRPEHFQRVDETDDALFYAMPRLVNHIDDQAIEAARAFYGSMLPEGGVILDLMSSWVSHLPEPSPYKEIVGLGMNDEELRENPQLARFDIHDLNENTTLPYETDTFDGAVVTVSVQYLTSPVAVFAEVGRVLKPGAPFIATFSNRCFPTKAVAIWQALGDQDHAELVALYFDQSGAFDSPHASDLSPMPGVTDPLYAVYANARE